ncbi:hypothetical protein [Mycobacterium sp. URHB0044]|uniref:hypothetical protein n=1 Tax=Mycobacterium sp. URHB0044 TaxID=1380386 RepID=UPI0012DEA3BE|nr:hypothetical protein [Mycobacterium sp. URHB0044]
MTAFTISRVATLCNDFSKLNSCRYDVAQADGIRSDDFAFPADAGPQFGGDRKHAGRRIQVDPGH